MKITDETRRKVQQMTEEVRRGFIDDSEVDFPDDEDLAALKREAAECRRAPRRPRSAAEKTVRAS